MEGIRSSKSLLIAHIFLACLWQRSYLKMIYDHEKVEETTFWNEYTKLELKKAVRPKDLIQEERRQGRQPTKWQRFFRFIAAGNGEDREEEPFLVTRKVLFWISRSKNVFHQPGFDERPFREFFISKIKYLAIFILSFNIVTLGLVILGCSLMIDESNFGAKPFKAALNAYIGVWVIYTLLCLLYFLVVIINPTRVLEFLRIDMYETWLSLGNCLLVGRFILIVNDFTRDYVYISQCVDLKDTQGDYSMWYLLFKTLLDFYQGVVICALPFQWPWVMGMAILLLFQVFRRLWNCHALLIDLPSALQTQVVYGLIAASLMYFLLIIAIVSFTFERSVKSSYLNIQDQKALRNFMEKLVDLLCRNVKIPLQQVHSLFQNIKILSPTSMRLSELDRRLNLTTGAINKMVDDLLFLAKIEEKRFSFTESYHHKLDLKEKVYDILDVFAYSHLMKGGRQPLFRLEIPSDCSITTDPYCFRILVLHALTALIIAEELSMQAIAGSANNVPSATERMEIVIRCTAEVQHLTAGSGSSSTHTTIGHSARNDLRQENRAQTKYHHANTTDTHNTQEGQAVILRVHIERRDENNTLHSRHDQYAGCDKLQSSCHICRTIVDTYAQGEFLLYPRKVEFTIPVILEGSLDFQSDENSGDNSSKSSSVQSSFSNVSLKSDNNASTTLMTNLRDKSGSKERDVEKDDILRQFMSNKVCIYITDTGLESLMMDAVNSLRHSELVMIHKQQLNTVDLQVRSVCFVQSLQACDELRLTYHFTGKIVLFSERLTYLDQRERSRFDKDVALPSTSREIRDLKVFLQTCLVDEMPLDSILKVKLKPKASLSSLSNTSYDENNTSLPSSSLLQQQGISSDKNTSLKAVANSMHSTQRRRTWLTSIFSIGTTYVPQHRLENYAKWRFFNVGGYLLHHTTNVEMFGVGGIVFISYQYHLQLFAQFQFVILTGFLFLLLYRRSFHVALKRLRLVKSFRYWWYACTTLQFMALIYVTITQFIAYYYFDPSLQKQLNDKTITFADFLQIRTGVQRRPIDRQNQNAREYTGIQLMFFIINLPIFIKTSGDFSPYPTNVSMIWLFIIRASFILCAYFSAFMSTIQLTIVLLFVIGLSLVLLSVQYFTEALYRDEFTELYDLIMSRSFLEKCLVFERSLDYPLSKMVEMQQGIIDLINEAAFANELLISKSLLKNVERLQQNLLVSKELVLEIALTDNQYFEQKDRAEVMFNMRAVLLRPLMIDICSKFADECNSIQNNVSIYLRMKTELTLIRLDPELLSAVLCKLCRNALLRIQECVQRSLDASVKHATHRRPSHTKKGSHTTTSLDKDEKESPYDDTHDNNMEQQKYSLLKHQLLIWIYPGELLPSQQPYRFTDVRRLEIVVMDTSAFEDYHYRSDLKHEIFGEIREMGNFPMADGYMNFFHFPIGKGSLYECGTVNHLQYRSYQRCSLPYVLCADSHRFHDLFVEKEGNSIFPVQCSSKQFYPAYAASYGDAIDHLNQEMVLSGDQHAIQQLRRQQQQQSRRTTSSTGTSTSATSSSSNHHHRHHHHKKGDKRSGSSSNNTTTNNNSNDVISLTNNSNATNRKIANNNASKAQQSSDSSSSSNNRSNSQDRQQQQAGGGDDANAVRQPALRIVVGTIAIFCRSGGDLSRAAMPNQSLFGAQGWVTRMNYCSKAMPNESIYRNVECIIFEYDPVLFATPTAAAAAAGGTRAKPTVHDPRSYIHYLRADGFQGVIVIAYPSASALSPDYDFDTMLREIKSVNRKQDAVTADLFLQLPLDQGKVAEIVSACERRLIMLSLSAYSCLSDIQE